MSGVLLPACAIFFSGLLCLVYFSKERINLLENKMYSLMIVSIFFDSILVTILQSFATNGITSLEYTLIPVLNKIDFIFLIIHNTCLLFYTILITIPKFKEKFKYYSIPFFILNFIVLIFTFLSKIELLNNNGNYTIGGTAVYYVYVLCAFYIILSILIVLFNIKHIDKRHIPILVIIFISILMVIFFNLNPYLIFISITSTFLNYVMFFTIENPDVKMIEQLNIAKEAADKANRAKTEFLSSMSHEIRTPLNAIVGFSECMLSSKDLNETKEFAKDVVDASQNLLEIVNGILDRSQ